MRTWTDDSVRLVGAVLDTRDALRGQVLPACDRLRGLVNDPEVVALVTHIRHLAGAEADRLRYAVKNRNYGTRGTPPRPAGLKNI